jgi:hypothetical protein
VPLVLDFALILIFLTSCLGAGQAVSRASGLVFRLDKSDNPQLGLESISLNCVVGSGILSLIWQLLGLAGGLTPAFVWPVLAVFVGAAVSSLKPVQILKDASSNSRTSLAAVFVKPVVILSALCVALILWYGLLAYVRPPFGDADAFYMTYAKIIGATGLIIPMPGNYHDFSAIGLSGELHYAAMFALGGSSGAAKILAWAAGLNTLFLLLSIIRLSGGGIYSQTIAALMVLTSTTVTDYLSDGKTDLFAAALAMGGVYCALLAARPDQRLRMLALSGFLTGMALAAKLSFIVVMVPSLAVLLFYSLDVLRASMSRNLRRIASLAGYGLVFLASAGLAAFPHLLKNGLLFNNPFAPFFSGNSSFGSEIWYSPTDTAWIVMTYPFALVYGIYPLMGGNISMLWIVALPVAILYGKEILNTNKVSFLLFIAGIAGLAAWLVVKPSIFAPRYILPVLLILFPLPVMAVERMMIQESKPKAVSASYIVLAICVAILAPLSAPAGVWTALPKTVFDYLKSGTDACGLSISSYCNDFYRLNGITPKGDRVFLAGYYSYHLREDLLQCVNTVDETSDIASHAAPDIWQSLFDNGFTVIAVQKATHAAFVSKLDVSRVPEGLKVSIEIADTDMPVYRLESTNSQHMPLKACREQGNRRWAPALETGNGNLPEN